MLAVVDSTSSGAARLAVEASVPPEETVVVVVAPSARCVIMESKKKLLVPSTRRSVGSRGRYKYVIPTGISRATSRQCDADVWFAAAVRRASMSEKTTPTKATLSRPCVLIIGNQQCHLYSTTTPVFSVLLFFSACLKYSNAVRDEPAC